MALFTDKPQRYVQRYNELSRSALQAKSVQVKNPADLYISSMAIHDAW
jgi:hypothetical protein